MFCFYIMFRFNFLQIRCKSCEVKVETSAELSVKRRCLGPADVSRRVQTLWGTHFCLLYGYTVWALWSCWDILSHITRNRWNGTSDRWVLGHGSLVSIKAGFCLFPCGGGRSTGAHPVHGAEPSLWILRSMHSGLVAKIASQRWNEEQSSLSIKLETKSITTLVQEKPEGLDLFFFLFQKTVQ